MSPRGVTDCGQEQNEKKVGEVEEDCENNLATYRKRKEMFDLLPPLCVRLSYVDDFIPNSQLRLLISLYAGH